ncbi:MAG: ISAzo13 family transposase [Gemmatimonadales bacterium]
MGSAASEDDKRWLAVLATLPEKQRRWMAGSKAIELGRGGLARVTRLTGFSVNTIRKGMAEVRAGLPEEEPERQRAPGAGRKSVEEKDPGLLRALDQLLDDHTVGDPMSPVKWTHKSHDWLARQLRRQGHRVAPKTVGRLLGVLEYSPRGNAKDKEGRSPPERDAQFRHINTEVERFHAAGNPVLSVDCKKKERVGNFKNPGKAYRKRGDVRRVNTYDFPRLAVGQASPYGIYDQFRNMGFVNVGVSGETGEFAVDSLRWWWRDYGRRHYPRATGLLVCADSGGGNSARRNDWKIHLQRFADELGFPITVCHYPPGTSKWNKVEHRLFSFISVNWQGVPLETYAIILNLIRATRTRTGLRVKARLDRKTYRKGVKIPKEALAALQLRRDAKMPQWNYTILPRRKRPARSRR